MREAGGEKRWAGSEARTVLHNGEFTKADWEGFFKSFPSQSQE